MEFLVIVVTLSKLSEPVTYQIAKYCPNLKRSLIYLGSVLEENDRSSSEIQRRIAIEKTPMMRLQSVSHVIERSLCKHDARHSSVFIRGQNMDTQTRRQAQNWCIWVVCSCRSHGLHWMNHLGKPPYVKDESWVSLNTWLAEMVRIWKGA